MKSGESESDGSPEAQTTPSHPTERPTELSKFLDDWHAEIVTRRIFFEAEHRAFDRWIEARERMDYWITGVAGAVLAYAVQSYDAGVIQHARWLAPLSWASLLAAVIFGVLSLSTLAKSNLAWLSRAMTERGIRKRIAGLERQALWKRYDGKHLVQRTTEEEAEFAALEEFAGDLQDQGLALNIEHNKDSSASLSRLETKAARLARLRSLLFISGLFLLATLRLLNLGG